MFTLSSMSNFSPQMSDNDLENVRESLDFEDSLGPVSTKQRTRDESVTREPEQKEEALRRFDRTTDKRVMGCAAVISIYSHIYKPTANTTGNRPSQVQVLSLLSGGGGGPASVSVARSSIFVWRRKSGDLVDPPPRKWFC